MPLFSRKHTHHTRSNNQETLIDRVRNDPYTDWFLMVSVAFVLSLVFVGFGFVNYFRTQDRLAGTASVGGTVHARTFDSAALAHVLDGFAARATERASLIKGESVGTDPSL